MRGPFLDEDKPIGTLPLTKCHFSHSVLWLRRILGRMGGGGLKKGGNAPWATESQRCKSSSSYYVCDTFSLALSCLGKHLVSILCLVYITKPVVVRST
jgi:hypothetical protein